MAQSAGIAKVGNVHESIADWLLANPSAHQSELAKEMGYSEAWLSTVINCDAFKVYFAERRAALSLIMHHGIGQQMANLTKKSLALLEEKLDDPELDASFVLDVADKMLHRQGYAPGKSNVVVHAPNGVVVNGAVAPETLNRARDIMRIINSQSSGDPANPPIEVVPEPS